MPKPRSSHPSSRRARRRYAWETLADEQLLSLRFCDLKLTMEDTDLDGAIEKLYGELATRGIRFRPHCWLSQEWFSPDGIPGIAIPFYLAHPRLSGSSGASCARSRAATAAGCCGSCGTRRVTRSTPPIGCGAAAAGAKCSDRPRCRTRIPTGRGRAAAASCSTSGAWYAQAHPTEDFAETFAVWLKPRSAWRREYSGWPAFAKLEFIDELAARSARPARGDRPQPRRGHRRGDGTLREHYERKLARYRMPRRSGADELLLKVFTAAPRRGRRPRRRACCATCAIRCGSKIVRSGAFSEYLVHQVLRLMIERCESLNLYLRGPRRELRSHLLG